VPILLIVARAAHFGSCLTLQSVFAILLLVLLPAWQSAGGELSAVCRRVDQLLRRLLVACLGVAFVSGFLWFWLAIAGMSGSSLVESLQPGLFWMVLTQTQPGQVWLLRAGLGLGFVIALFCVSRTSRGLLSGSGPALPCALFSTLLTASLAWLGHAGAGEGPNQNLQLIGDLLHLIAAGFWPAGLVPAAVFLPCLFRAREPEALLAACAAARRFSLLSVVAVDALVLSGLANTWFLVGTFHALLATEYGRLLIIKLVLFGAMFCIGAWNLLVLKPQLDVADSMPPGGAQAAALAKITRNVLIEIALGALVLLIVGLLGITAPGIHS